MAFKQQLFIYLTDCNFNNTFNLFPPMQINNVRQKRKNIAKALESIAVPAANQRLKVFTENT